MSYSEINSSPHLEGRVENKVSLSNGVLEEMSDQENEDDELNTSLSHEVSFYFAKPNDFER
jgi:hypothetical protein